MKKAEQQHVKDEVRILMRTEAILRSRDTNIGEFNEELAAKKGVAGHQQTADDLEVSNFSTLCWF
jgi:NADH:ubiquinone oxidoreductase subunit D